MKSERASWIAESSRSSELVSTQVVVSSAWRLTHRASTDMAPIRVARMRRTIGSVRRFLTATSLGVPFIRCLLSSFRLGLVLGLLGAGTLEVGGDPYRRRDERRGQNQP